MKPYTGCIIQARLSSTRFPNKILSDFMGKPLIEHIVERCHESRLVDKVVLATPHQIGVCLNEELFIGSEDNVLDRYYKCATNYEFKIIVRITSDCPLVSPHEIDRVLERLYERDTHYVTNIGAIGRFGLPDGMDVEAFTYQALKDSWLRHTSDEHVTTWIKSNEEYNPIYLEPPKLSVDTVEDLERIKLYVSGWKADSNNRWNGIICSQLPKSYTTQS